MPRFSLKDIESASRQIDPIFLNSPQYECETLGDYFGAKIILKVEALNPVRSFKGRGADLLVQHASTNPLLCASAGNFGQAMAYACRKKGIDLTVYASESANSFKVEMMRRLGAKVILKGTDFDSAKLEARKYAEHAGIRFVEDSLDVDTVIGAGTIGIELQAYEGEIDLVLVPLGNGALINGIGTVVKAYRPETKVLAIQSEGAPAMIESWRKGKLVTHEEIRTIADGIGVRIPVKEALQDMDGLVDDGLLVKEESILEGMKLLHRHAGISVEPSAAVGIAALLEKSELFKDKTVVIVVTGSNLTGEQLERWF